MKVWLLENGQKTGPHESFEIRERIDAGELQPETMAWYQGAKGWGPLSEVPQFETLFLKAEELEADISSPPPIPAETAKQVNQIREAIADERSKALPLYATRRLFARFFDCSLYGGILLIVFQERLNDIQQNDSMFPLIGVGLAYVIIDGLMTHLWRLSPGKFLLGLRTTDALGHAIPLKFALLRSLRVWILGLGMWVVWPIALFISWVVSRKFGYFLWDMPKRYRTVARPFSGLHVIAYVVALFIMNLTFMELMPKERIEDQRALFQELLEKWK